MQAKHSMQVKEQRVALRSHVDLPVALSHFHTGRNFQPMAVKACNQSVSGLCIISPHELQRRMVVFVRALSCRPAANSSAPLFKNSAIGEVRWCRKTADREGGQFLAGIRYY